MLDSLATLCGKAELERVCPVIQEHSAGLQDGHSGTWAICVSHVFLLKSPATTEPPPYPLSLCCPASSTTSRDAAGLKSTVTSAVGSTPVDLRTLR